jgi:hypothetical protein
MRSIDPSPQAEQLRHSPSLAMVALLPSWMDRFSRAVTAFSCVLASFDRSSPIRSGIMPAEAIAALFSMLYLASSRRSPVAALQKGVRI